MQPQNKTRVEIVSMRSARRKGVQMEVRTLCTKVSTLGTKVEDKLVSTRVKVAGTRTRVREFISR